MASPNFVAGSNILPSTFVKIENSGTAFDTAVQANNVADIIIGISQDGTDGPPIANAGVYCATAGESFRTFGQGDICLLLSTSAGWAAGDKLAAANNGAGVTVSSGPYGALALEPVVGIALGRVQVTVGAYHN